ncbi:MAG: TonB-dependent receptor, partial [Candidatus Symbiothrix sp.]|jgi:hypothetical protein|nr:TonB-dependent receptor [Candidatus Symbiothrix sp.]
MELYDISAKMSQSVVNGQIVETPNNTFVLSQREAKDIRWEAQTSFGLALDGRVFDRVNFSLEYFDKRSRDLLFQVPLPQSAGAIGASSKSPLDWKNIGTLSNYGFELSLNVDLYRTKDFHWHADLNATALKNKILSLPPKEGGDNSIYPAYSRKSNGDIDSRTNQKYAEGHSIYEFYIYQYKGVDQMDGRALYKLDTDAWYIAEQPPADVTGKDLLAKKDDSGENNYVIINGVAYAYKAANAKREFSGSPIPKVMGSFSTGITYKGLALDVLFSYGLGGKVLDSPYEKLMSLGTAGTLHSLHPDLLKSWTGMPEGMTETSANRIDPNGIPGVNYQYNSYNNITSTRWLVNASYLMFKNINVSYALPKQWIQGLELSNVRLNATVENLHLFSARKGLNPQTDFDGEMGDVASMPRTISLGLKVDF